MVNLLDIAKVCDRNDKLSFNRITEYCNKATDESINKLVDTKSLKSKNKYQARYVTCLDIAVEFADSVFVAKLLKHGATTDINDERGESVLHKACRSKIETESKVLLLFDHDPGLIGKETKTGSSPLHVASRKKSSSTLCKLLLSQNADINAVTKKFLTPLHVASYHGCKDNVIALLSNDKIDVNKQDMNYDTPLHHATSRGHYEVAKVIEQHPDTLAYLTNKHGRTAAQENQLNIMLLQNMIDSDMKTVARLVKLGARCIENESQENPMHIACTSETDAYEKLAILYKLDPEQLFRKTKASELPIHYAARNKDQRLIEFISQKCDINITNAKDQSAIILAAKSDNSHVVRFLLNETTCDVNKQDAEGNTAAHYAILNNNESLYKTISNHPQFHPLCNRDGKTPEDINPLNIALVRMCKLGTAIDVDRMLSAGARLTIDSNGDTCLHYACVSDTDGIEKCRILLDKDPQLLNCANGEGKTALHITSGDRNTETTRFLLQCPDIDVNARDNQKNTPLHISVAENSFENLRFLALDSRIELHYTNDANMTARRLAWALNNKAMEEFLKARAIYILSNQKGPEIVPSYGRLTELKEHVWKKHKILRIEKKYTQSLFKVYSMTLIQGKLYCCTPSRIVVCNLEPDDIQYIHREEETRRVYHVAELENGDLVLAARRGIFQLPLTDELNSTDMKQLSTEAFNSIGCHNKRIYAASSEEASLHIYDQTSASQPVKRIHLVGGYHEYGKIYVNDSGVYVTSYADNRCLKLPLDGGSDYKAFQLPAPIQKGNDSVGPRLCHGDDEGSILIAGHRSNELYVLENESKWSSVRVEGLEKPECALYLPGRLYVCSEGTMTLYRPETL